MKPETHLWSCVGRSVTGVSHAKAGLPCQDYCKVAQNHTVRRVAALADGAGSAKYSQEGARLAVETIIDVIANNPGELKDLTDVEALEFGRAVRHALIERSKVDECELGDYACTLLAAVFEGEHSYFWQIGDGSWVVEANNSKIECATWPFKGAFNNETAFITQEDWDELKDGQDAKWQFAHYKDVTAAMGFTDGLEMFCLNAASKEPHFPFVERIFAALRSQPSESEVALKMEQLLGSQLIVEREDDDLTMVLAWKT